MSDTTLKQILDRGDMNAFASASKAIGLGSRLLGGSGARIHHETVAVASDAATPTHTIKKLLFCEVSGGTGGNAEKIPQLRGGSTATTNYVAPSADGTSIDFKASEVTGGAAVAEIIYLTEDPPLDESGQAFASLDDSIAGVY